MDHGVPSHILGSIRHGTTRRNGHIHGKFKTNIETDQLGKPEQTGVLDSEKVDTYSKNGIGVDFFMLNLH
jgi:hypothetical protein